MQVAGNSKQAVVNRKPAIMTVVRIASGNFLEMYDFMVFGYYAAAIGRTFFPSSNPFLSLMLSLGTFGVGFLMRPLGAFILGAYMDRHGRRRGLLVTLLLMSLGTLSIAVMPGVCKHRHGGASAGGDRPIAAGILGRRGTGRRVRVPCRNRHAGP
jgi:MFS family permease